MAITYGFYNSLNGDRVYNARDMSAIFDGIINDGIFMSIGTAFTTEAAGGMVVNVGVGRAWFNSTWTYNDSILPLKVDMSDAVNKRIDSVIIDINTNTTARRNRIMILEGTAGVSPTPPTLTNGPRRFQYRLANITVRPSTDEITTGDIEVLVGQGDTPFVTGILETLDIEPLILQWEYNFNLWNQQKQDEMNKWMTQRQQSMDNWTANEKADFLNWRQTEESSFTGWRDTEMDKFVTWFEGARDMLDGDVAGNIYQILEYHGVVIEGVEERVDTAIDGMNTRIDTAMTDMDEKVDAAIDSVNKAKTIVDDVTDERWEWGISNGVVFIEKVGVENGG